MDKALITVCIIFVIRFAIEGMQAVMIELEYEALFGPLYIGLWTRYKCFISIFLYKETKIKWARYSKVICDGLYFMCLFGRDRIFTSFSECVAGGIQKGLDIGYKLM